MASLFGFNTGAVNDIKKTVKPRSSGFMSQGQGQSQPEDDFFYKKMQDEVQAPKKPSLFSKIASYAVPALGAMFSGEGLIPGLAGAYLNNQKREDEQNKTYGDDLSTAANIEARRRESSYDYDLGNKRVGAEWGRINKEDSGDVKLADDQRAMDIVKRHKQGLPLSAEDKSWYLGYKRIKKTSPYKPEQ